jgi:hypothetical protein
MLPKRIDKSLKKFAKNSKIPENVVKNTKIP